MALSVIGSGFGRTGTKSLKEALEQLGFAPCHHMHEIVTHPEQVAHWQSIAAGQPVDWNDVFAGYQSQVDWPGSHVWRELSAAYPDARVVHTLRPAETWWNSYSKTIGKLMSTYRQIPLPPHITAILDVWNRMVGDTVFSGRPNDRDTCIAAFNRNTQQVRDTIPADRLLVFDVAEGWEPLCRFLGVAVPATAFPHHNLRADFWEVLGGEPA
jgi:hypothetical protein